MKHIGYLAALGRPLPTYKGPPWPQAQPEVPATDEDLARFREAFPGVTCSDRVLRILAALHRDYAIRRA